MGATPVLSFYMIMDYTVFQRGVMPYISTILEGYPDLGPCPECYEVMGHLTGDLQVKLAASSARVWPDLLECEEYPCFIVSQRFIDAMRADDIRIETGGRVYFEGPIENGLSLDDAPEYYWLDGRERHQAAKMDFEASGYVDVRFCKVCGNRTDDPKLSRKHREGETPPPFVFDYDASTKHDLFTTDLSPIVFFCTDRVLETVKKRKLTNIQFFHVERGGGENRIVF